MPRAALSAPSTIAASGRPSTGAAARGGQPSQHPHRPSGAWGSLPASATRTATPPFRSILPLPVGAPRARRERRTRARPALPRAEASPVARTWRDGGVSSPRPRRRRRRLAVGAAAGSAAAAAASLRGGTEGGVAYAGNGHRRAEVAVTAATAAAAAHVGLAGVVAASTSPIPPTPRHIVPGMATARGDGGGRGGGRRRPAPRARRGPVWASPTLPAPSRIQAVVGRGWDG